MTWGRLGTCLAFASIVACASCGSFGSAEPSPSADAGAGVEAGVAAGDAAPACARPSCAGDGTTCNMHAFESGCADVVFGGDRSGVVADCATGSLHLAASDTLDVTAELGFDAPPSFEAFRVSAAIAVKSWDGGRLLRLAADGVLLAELRAVTTAKGFPRFSLCDENASCAASTFDAAGAEEHVFAFDVSSSGVVLSVDCARVATLPLATLLRPNARLLVTFGKFDATAIDGTLDDLVVSYR